MLPYIKICEVNGTGSVSCSVANFVTTGVEPLRFAQKLSLTPL